MLSDERKQDSEWRAGIYSASTSHDFADHIDPSCVVLVNRSRVTMILMQLGSKLSAEKPRSYVITFFFNYAAIASPRIDSRFRAMVVADWLSMDWVVGKSIIYSNPIMSLRLYLSSPSSTVPVSITQFLFHLVKKYSIHPQPLIWLPLTT